MLLLSVEVIPPHTVAIDVEPSEAMTSEFTRTVYGKFASGGNTASSAFSASVPTKTKQQKQLFNTVYHFLILGAYNKISLNLET